MSARETARQSREGALRLGRPFSFGRKTGVVGSIGRRGQDGCPRRGAYGPETMWGYRTVAGRPPANEPIGDGFQSLIDPDRSIAHQRPLPPGHHTLRARIEPQGVPGQGFQAGEIGPASVTPLRRRYLPQGRSKGNAGFPRRAPARSVDRCDRRRYRFRSGWSEHPGRR